MPVQQSGERYAVFIRPTYPLKAVDFRKALQLHVITVLVVGGLFMLLVASYLVKPLNMLTKATRRLAKGDFDVQMELNRTDEIGVLSASFNEMTFELRRLEQMRQDFVSNVSHEIQTPLTSIIGFTKALRSAEMPEEERLYYLHIIQSESERISRLSDNLLRLASLESEHHPFHKSTFRLDEQIRRIVVVCEPVWSQKELQIELDLPKTTIAGDPDLLSQVWMNLLGNSIKFTPEGGRIGLRIEAELSSVKVSISDTGAGIPEHEHAMIFHQFYKGDPSRSDSTGGSGLGLAIVKKIVSLHKGTIVVESQAGEGTRMSVILPSIA
ncbi:sensor histidine kinase [Paenibacillus sp. TAB 01]|uniref:sensor histidine kinase n=1 Tax=Paenibacillus sp. TAB 01 TaxID=3368988 RepID=UPI00375087B3